MCVSVSVSLCVFVCICVYLCACVRARVRVCVVTGHRPERVHGWRYRAPVITGGDQGPDVN